jgi:hypothetical protein
VSANQDAGTASLQVKGLKCPDYFSLGNALTNGGSVPAETTFDVQWFGPTTPATWGTKEFVFDGMQTQSSFIWSASEAGGIWVSDPAIQVVESAFVGMEHNGVFR